MAYKLIVIDAAYSDLDDALDHMANRLANPGAAANMLTPVEERHNQSYAVLF